MYKGIFCKRKIVPLFTEFSSFVGKLCPQCKSFGSFFFPPNLVHHLHYSCFFQRCFLIYDFFLQPAFLVDVFGAKESTDVQDSNVDSLKQTAKEAGSQGSKNSSLVDALLHYVDRANDLINKYKFCSLFNFYSGFFFGLFIIIVIFYGFSLTRFIWLHLFLDLHLIC